MSFFKEYNQDFSLDPKAVWLNAASEGPLPQCSAKTLHEAIVLKSSPHLLTISKFQQVPLHLKDVIARLIHVDSKDVILGNSATYGLHLLANGLPFKSGDEIITLENDFPSDILPWLSLEKKGVIVHQLKAHEHVLSLEEIKKAINSNTKLICLPYVHSFSGFKEDVVGIGKICRQYGILFVVNLSQALGVVPFNMDDYQIDAVVCAGYKWLLGPYGTGFCWMTKALREQLDYPQNYWISLMDEKSLSHEGSISFKDTHESRRYDVFGTANFFNFMPWSSSIEYLLSQGIESIEAHNQSLVEEIVTGLDLKKFDLISPKDERINIVVFSCKDKSRNGDLYDYLKQKGFYLALWKNKLRISPHLYNTLSEIKKFLAILEAYGAK